MASAAGLARLVRRFPVALMADESLQGPESAFEIAKIAGADVFAIKIEQSGGLFQAQRVAAIADAAGIGLYGGTMLEGAVGTIASAQLFSMFVNLQWGTELFGPLLPDLLDAHAATRDAHGVWRGVSQALQSAWGAARDAHFRDDRLDRDAPSFQPEPVADIGFEEIVIEVEGARQSAGVDATRLHAALERQIRDFASRSADLAREECALSLGEMVARATHLDAMLRAHEARLRDIRNDLRTPA